MVENLYELIGGCITIEAATELFYNKVLQDDSLRRFFDRVDMAHLRSRQAMFISMLLAVSCVGKIGSTILSDLEGVAASTGSACHSGSIELSTTTRQAIEKLQTHPLTIGLDLGDRSSYYCVLDESGRVLVEDKVATTPKALEARFGAMPRSRIALEAGMHSPWVSRLLNSDTAERVADNHWSSTRLSAGLPLPRIGIVCRRLGKYLSAGPQCACG